MSFFSFFIHACLALYLPDMKKEDLQDKTIAYYPGSFDPLHLGHQNNIQEALKHVDYVLVYPSFDSQEKKKKLTQKIRFQMMKTLYHKDPRVIWTDQTPGEMQEFFKSFKVKFWGIIGSDRALQMCAQSNDKERKRYLSIYMKGVDFKNLSKYGIPQKKYEAKFTKGEYGVVSVFKAEKMIISRREEDDLTPLHNKLGNMDIAAIIENQKYKDVSSTKIRDNVKNGKSLEGLVDPKIEEMIKESYK